MSSIDWGTRLGQSEDWFQKPVVSVCSLGRARWFWVAWRTRADAFGYQDGGPAEPVAIGYEETREDARRAALQHAPTGAVHYTAGVAANYHRARCVRKRAEGCRSECTQATAPEFVYSRRGSDWRAHRIVKKTAKRVYVAYDSSRVDKDDWDVQTFVLDREELERTGRAIRRVRHWDQVFYLRPPEPETKRGVPPCIERLGLSYPCTVADVKRAFRLLAKDAHPDRGGDAKEFIEIQSAYEKALSLLAA